MILAPMRSYLVPAKQGIKYQTSIRQLIARKGVALLHRACVWRPGLAQVRKIRIVVRPVRRAECVLRTDERCGRMGKIIVHLKWM